MPKPLNMENGINKHLHKVLDGDGNPTAMDISTDSVRVNNLEVTGITTGISIPDDTKLPLAGGTMTGDIAMSDAGITDVKELVMAAGEDGISLDGGSNYIQAFKDEDNMASNSDTAICSQQSIKAYVDANAGGGGTNTLVWSFSGRIGQINSDTKFWTSGSFGLMYPFWSSSNQLTDRNKGWSDTNEYGMANRVIHVPYNGTLKGHTGNFYNDGNNTYLFEIWKATPSYPTSTVSDLVFADTSLGVTSTGGASYRMEQWSKTDGGVSVSAGDVLALYVSRASGTSNAYVYFNWNVIMEKS